MKLNNGHNDRQENRNLGREEEKKRQKKGEIRHRKEGRRKKQVEAWKNVKNICFRRERERKDRKVQRTRKGEKKQRLNKKMNIK